MPVARRRPNPPSAGTLAKYGLTAAEWWSMCVVQDFACPVCGQPFGDRPLVIDHEHVKGWRARKTRGGRKVRVMDPRERRKYVRGVLHSFCNRYVRRWLTLEFVHRVGPYLEAYRARSEAAARG